MQPRLYVEHRLMRSSSVELSGSQAHYIRHVLRLKEGANILLFNGIDGEWLAELQQTGKHTVVLVCRSNTREQTQDLDLVLICSLIKPNRLELLIEKATELGVTQIIPVISDFCAIRKINMDRLRIHAIEAAEQSERLSIPLIHNPQPIRETIIQYKNPIIWADESKINTKSLCDVLSKGEASTILIGPEGGFSEKERDFLRELEKIRPVHLGPLILRAETAAIALLAAKQAVSGTWR